mgnify:CR=1 FL=1
MMWAGCCGQNVGIWLQSNAGRLRWVYGSVTRVHKASCADMETSSSLLNMYCMMELTRVNVLDMINSGYFCLDLTLLMEH